MIQPSPLSLVAAALYLVLVALIGFTGWKTRSHQQAGYDHRFWFTAATIFGLLALSRILAIEELFRSDLREWLEGSALYADRQTMQLPLAIAALGVAAIIAGGWLLKWRATYGDKPKQAILLACAGLAAMAVLIMLRMVSLHSIDSWLYYGLRLNWWINIGASLLVALAAWKYLLTLRR